MKNESKFYVATFNVRTMSRDEHVVQMEEALKNINYDVIGLCEVKREDETILERNDFILYTKTITRRRGSVGLLVKKKYKDAIEHFKSQSDRVCHVTIKLKQGILSIIQAYAPHSGRPDKEIAEFYKDLQKTINETEKSNYQVIMGDFNAKIGEPIGDDNDVMGQFGFCQRNERGQNLIDFARSQELLITNTLFKKRAKRRVTWSMGNANNEIDFIMVKNEMKNLVKNVSVVNKFEYSSDHKMLRMKINLKAMKKRFKIFTPKITVSDSMSEILKSKRDLNEEIEKKRSKVADNESTGVEENDNVQVKYESLVESIISAAKHFRKKKPQEKILSEETKLIIDEREKPLILKNQDPSLEDKFKKTRKETNTKIRQDLRMNELSKLKNAIDKGKSWKKITNTE